MTSLPGPTWFVGCGNMAGAMVEGWRKAGVDLFNAIAIRPSGKPVDGVRTVADLPEGPPPALAVLGFKPQKLDEIAPDLATRLGPDTVLVSILAGAEAASLRLRFPSVGPVVRAMPNLPVSESRGIVALYSEDAGQSDRDRLFELFGLLGRAHWARDEAELAAIGSVAGAGPAYVARFIAALAKAGEARGLAPGLAQAIALETVAGTALMAEARGEAMDEIARRVASPRGTTEAGLAILDADGALDRLIAETIEAAARRGVQLAEQARRP
jgi:pyrroline-5-carboxylate reductase